MLQVWAANSFLLFKVFQDLLVRYGKKKAHTLCPYVWLSNNQYFIY